MNKAVLILAVLLVGCAKDTTVTDDVFTGIHTEIDNLTHQLPAECKTAAVTREISALTDRVLLAQKSCNKDIGDCRAEIRRWRCRFYGVVFAVIAAAALLLYRRVRKVF